jgi:3-hydroxyisobutyrate dehydrogenase-like beta-hydroxyacid dehydrogenase
MDEAVAFLGFGEAAQAFAGATGWRGPVRAYDRLTDAAATRDGKYADYRRCKVVGVKTSADALSGAPVVISLVTADQALACARDAAAHITPGSLYCDMNSVAPATKAAAAGYIAAAGAHYVDVAVMAPVHPLRLAVPLLLSGAHAQQAAAMLADRGFSAARIMPGDIGRASSVKMIRSVMIKGIEALTAEMIQAADAAGVRDEVLASLGSDWNARADYNLDRMRVHGLRRAAEMEEVAQTLEDLKVPPLMTRGTIIWQRNQAA